jgi:hypothetical protein
MDKMDHTDIGTAASLQLNFTARKFCSKLSQIFIGIEILIQQISIAYNCKAHSFVS